MEMAGSVSESASSAMSCAARATTLLAPYRAQLLANRVAIPRRCVPFPVWPDPQVGRRITCMVRAFPVNLTWTGFHAACFDETSSNAVWGPSPYTGRWGKAISAGDCRPHQIARLYVGMFPEYNNCRATHMEP